MDTITKFMGRKLVKCTKMQKNVKTAGIKNAVDFDFKVEYMFYYIFQFKSCE